MNLQRWAKEVQDQRLSSEQIALIRKSANEMVKHPVTEACGKVLLRMCNHVGILNADIEALQAGEVYLTERLKREMKRK